MHLNRFMQTVLRALSEAVVMDIVIFLCSLIVVMVVVYGLKLCRRSSLSAYVKFKLWALLNILLAGSLFCGLMAADYTEYLLGSLVALAFNFFIINSKD